MQTISKPLFVYLQRPDTGEWVTVGRYTRGDGEALGHFQYAPSYAAAGLTWAIDPVNLPFVPDVDHVATRYQGLHDVLRDACPDGWGQALLQREHHLTAATPMSRYLALASNSDRWGALAVGHSKTPSIAHLASPRLPQLEQVICELDAMSARKPAIDQQIRRRLQQTVSVGGARPKATVREGEVFWIAKPGVASDVAEIPALEHFCQLLGTSVGLNFARSRLHRFRSNVSAVLVERFDRCGERRFMCVSAASLLQAEYPGAGSGRDKWSYPRLAEELLRIGAPDADRRELFGRMVFNAVCGNDDDHLRNHAVRYDPSQRRWRLSPAYDVVPNVVEAPRMLAMQTASGRYDISRQAILQDAWRFGFANDVAAAAQLNHLLDLIAEQAPQHGHCLSGAWRVEMLTRIAASIALLRTATAG